MTSQEVLTECPKCRKFMKISQDKNWLECSCGNSIALRGRGTEIKEPDVIE